MMLTYSRIVAMIFVAGALTAPAQAHRTPNEVPRRSVSGRVFDAGTGKPIESVPITVIGEAIGTLTNANGKFTMAAVPATRSRIEFRHPCYFAVQVNVSNDTDAEIEIGLPFDQSSLNRPGCGGLAERTKRDTTR